MSAVPRKVLVVRNDKLGDFVLSTPCYEVLRRGLPQAELVALAPEYTREVAELCPAIDRVLIDPGAASPEGAAGALARSWRGERFDAMVVLFSTARVALAGFLARIPERVAPATKIFQFLHNRRVFQRRSRSVQPEYEYNLDLVRRLLRGYGIEARADFSRPVLRVDRRRAAARRAELCLAANVDSQGALVFAHPGHGGSANNLDLDQYAELLGRLESRAGHAFVLTAGPGELDKARRLAELLGDRPHFVYESTDGVGAFCEVLAAADLFVGGSSGPLHIAGALDRPTVGFYPRRLTSSPLRWQTLNSPERRLAFAPPAMAHERDMSAIALDRAAREISARFL